MSFADSAGIEVVAADLIRVGKIMYDRGLTASNDGNISAKAGADTIMITATGACKGRMDRGQLSTISIQTGEIIDGSLAPSSETDIHLATYRNRPDVNAVIHAHSPFLTALAITGTAFPSDVLPEVVFTLGEVPTSRPAIQRTPDYLDSIVTGLGPGQALLLDHHGAMTVGDSLEGALITLERIEHVAHVFWIARSIGSVQHLPPETIARLAELRHPIAPE